MSAQLFYNPQNVLFTSRSLPAGAASVYFFYTDTTSEAPIYSDAELTVPLLQPVSADGLGRLPNIYMDSAITYRVRAVDSNGAPMGLDTDPYIPGTTGDAAAAAAAGSAAAAKISETNAEESAAQSEAAATNSANSASAADLASLLAGAYDNTAKDNVPRGAVAYVLTPGSGGANGTNIAATFSSGNFAGNPSILFDIVGGAVTNVRIVHPGLYIGASPSVPTVALPGGAGGAALTLTAGFLISNGGGYWVKSLTGTSISGYLNVAGVATPDGLPPLTFPDYISPTGSMKYVRGTGDVQGTLMNSIDAAGVVYGPPLDTAKKRGSYKGTLSQDIYYGQSESVGQAAPAISTQARYSSIKMFAGGMRPQYDHAGSSDATNYGSFVAAAEVTSTVNTALGESFCVGSAEAIVQLVADEDGVNEADHDYRLLVSAPGLGATSIAGLSKPSTPYTRVITQATYGYNNERATNGWQRFGAFHFIHGVNNAAFTPAAYLAALQQLQSDINTDLKAINGQSEDIPFILGQISSHKQSGQTVPGPALGMLAAMMADPTKFSVAGPMYPYEFQDNNNNVHLLNYAEKSFAAVLGFARKRRVNDGVLWKPVCPTGTVTSYGSTCKVFQFNVPDDRFGNPDELVWDTTNVLENTNYGIEAVASNGTTLLTQLTPRIVGRDEVLVEVPGGWPVGARLQGGWRGSGTIGPMTGPRTNLRASRETVIDPNGFAAVVRHWCAHFDIAA